MTDPDALIAWLPPEGMTGEMLEFDARPGGGYRMVLRYADEGIRGKSSAHEDLAHMRYVSLEPDREIVQTADFVSDDPDFSGTMTMRWTISPIAGGCDITLTAENVPPGISRADHLEGLASSLAKLAAYVTG